MRTVSVKYYLESRPNTEPTKLLPVFLYIRHQGRQIKTFTTRKCTKNGWDVSKGRANPRKYKNSLELNDFLADLETEATDLYNSNLRKGLSTSKEDLVKLIDKLSGNITDTNLILFAEDFISKAPMAENTKKSFKNTINILKDYASDKKRLLDFNDINMDFYDRFTDYMWKEKKFNDNTTGKHIKNIKKFMNEAFERDLHTNLDYKKKNFKVLQKSSDSIYLSVDELNKLLALQVTGLAEKVRDTFYVACWLGLRFSDLMRVTKDKIITEGGMTGVKITTQKTGQVVFIPIAPYVKPILEKYNYALQITSNQKMNEHLKTLGKDAGLNDEIEIVEEKNGRKIIEKIPKYKLITTHTARRSFATNLYLQGVKTETIRAVTGHKTEKVFLNYLKLSNLQKAKDLDKHFKTKMKVA